MLTTAPLMVIGPVDSMVMSVPALSFMLVEALTSTRSARSSQVVLTAPNPAGPNVAFVFVDRLVSGDDWTGTPVAITLTGRGLANCSIKARFWASDDVGPRE